MMSFFKFFLMSSLKDQTVKGVYWSSAENVITVGITFVVGLVLARLLGPEEYGLIGIITIFISVFNSIVDSGFSNALIRKKEVDNLDYNTIYITNLVFSVILFIVLFLIAPAISVFFNRPQLIPLTRVMGGVLIINAFSIIPRTVLVRQLDFKTQAKVSFIASIVSGVIGIGMALSGCGIWSLVGQQISRQFLNSALLWGWCHWRPQIEFSFSRFKDLFNFGWKLLVSGLIDTIWKEIYQVVIGKVYSPSTLGQYTRAQQFASVFSSNLTFVVQRVSFPALSQIQDDKLRLKLAYKRIIKVTMLVSFVLMLGMVGSAKQMVQVLVGDQWLPCVPYLQIICFTMMLYPLHAINLNMLQVQGRSDLFLKLEIIKKIIAVGPIVLGVFINIYWMLIGSVVTGFISYWLNAAYSGPFLNYSSKEQFLDILPSFGLAFIMMFAVLGMSYIPISPYVVFPLQIIVGALLTIGLCKLFKINEYQEIKDMVVPILVRFKLK